MAAHEANTKIDEWRQVYLVLHVAKCEHLRLLSTDSDG